jgi:uncharacterized protein YeeX (DUF496 family)
MEDKDFKDYIRCARRKNKLLQHIREEENQIIEKEDKMKLIIA